MSVSQNQLNPIPSYYTIQRPKVSFLFVCLFVFCCCCFLGGVFVVVVFFVVFCCCCFVCFFFFKLPATIPICFSLLNCYYKLAKNKYFLVSYRTIGPLVDLIKLLTPHPVVVRHR